VQVIRWIGPVGYSTAIDLVQRARFRVHQDPARLGFVHRNARVDAVTADLLPTDLEFNTEEHRVTGLTEREHEVLVELAAGRSNREIANTLQISENTVKNHVRSILEKLQAVSRVEAVVIGVQRGLVRVPSA
jgi:DNA-binding NarL/FixJ family response regulator